MSDLLKAILSYDADRQVKRSPRREKRLCPICICLKAAWIYDVAFEEVEETGFGIFTVTHFYPKELEDDILEWVEDVVLSVVPDAVGHFSVIMDWTHPPTRCEPFKARETCAGEGVE